MPKYKYISVLLNLPQLCMALFFCIFEIFFDQYESRTVGVGVTYAAYLLLSIVFSNFANICYGLIVKKYSTAFIFHKRTSLMSLSLVLLLIILAIQYEFVGTSI